MFTKVKRSTRLCFVRVFHTVMWRKYLTGSMEKCRSAYQGETDPATALFSRSFRENTTVSKKTIFILFFCFKITIIYQLRMIVRSTGTDAALTNFTAQVTHRNYNTYNAFTPDFTLSANRIWSITSTGTEF